MAPTLALPAVRCFLQTPVTFHLRAPSGNRDILGLGTRHAGSSRVVAPQEQLSANDKQMNGQLPPLSGVTALQWFFTIVQRSHAA